MKFDLRLLLLALLSLSIGLSSCSEDEDPNDKPQTEDPDRYQLEIFDESQATKDIVYGSNFNLSGDLKNLKMTIYEPKGDNASDRPVIILAPGGGFIVLDLLNMGKLGRMFARMGYVTIVMEYRLLELNQTTLMGLKTAAVQARSDMQAVIGFIREDRAMANTYRTDSTKIFLLGHSAGAVTSLHLAYLQDTTETDDEIDSLVLTNGGLKGNTGYPGHSDDVAGVVNMSGALFNADWVDAGEPPLLNLHGTLDQVVPYGFGNYSGIDGDIPLEGSQLVHQAAVSAGVKSTLITIQDGDHIAPLDPTQCPECLDEIIDFLYEHL